MKTIVDYFDPRDGEHLKAWRKLELYYLSLTPYPPTKWWILADAEERFDSVLGVGRREYHFCDDWGPLIIAKMANAWLEGHVPPDFVEQPHTTRRVQVSIRKRYTRPTFELRAEDGEPHGQ